MKLTQKLIFNLRKQSITKSKMKRELRNCAICKELFRTKRLGNRRCCSSECSKIFNTSEEKKKRFWR